MLRAAPRRESVLGRGPCCMGPPAGTGLQPVAARGFGRFQIDTAHSPPREPEPSNTAVRRPASIRRACCARPAAWGPCTRRPPRHLALRVGPVPRAQVHAKQVSAPITVRDAGTSAGAYVGGPALARGPALPSPARTRHGRRGHEQCPRPPPPALHWVDELHSARAWPAAVTASDALDAFPTSRARRRHRSPAPATAACAPCGPVCGSWGERGRERTRPAATADAANGSPSTAPFYVEHRRSGPTAVLACPPHWCAYGDAARGTAGTRPPPTSRSRARRPRTESCTWTTRR